MYKVIIWGLGNEYEHLINIIKYQESQGSISVVGVTDRNEFYESLDGYRFVSVKDIKVNEIDYIIVTSEQYFDEIADIAQDIGFSKDKLIRGKIFYIPGIDFDNYISLRCRNVSIIANNCWGGVVYHALGMPFLSPFINMFLLDDDYLKLLENLKYYVNCELQFVRYEYEAILKRNYPVCRLEDVELHFNHYVDMNEVEEKWYSRCERINWDNLFIMMFSGKEDSAERFQKLNFDKKICFVPFESTYKSIYTLKLAAFPQMKKVPFWRILMGGQSMYRDYDLVELLLNGKTGHSRIIYQNKKEID